MRDKKSPHALSAEEQLCDISNYYIHHERSSKTFVMALSGCFETDVQCLRNNQTERWCHYVRALLKAELTSLGTICKYEQFFSFLFFQSHAIFSMSFPACFLNHINNCQPGLRGSKPPERRNTLLEPTRSRPLRRLYQSASSRSCLFLPSLHSQFLALKSRS